MTWIRTLLGVGCAVVVLAACSSDSRAVGSSTTTTTAVPGRLARECTHGSLPTLVVRDSAAAGRGGVSHLAIAVATIRVVDQTEMSPDGVVVLTFERGSPKSEVRRIGNLFLRSQPGREIYVCPN